MAACWQLWRKLTAMLSLVCATAVAAAGQAAPTNVYGATTSSLGPPSGISLSGTTGGSLMPSTTYCYRVTTYNTVGQTVASSPETCMAPGVGHNAMKISWTAFGSTVAAGYGIYGRTSGAEGLIAQQTPGAATSYTDTGGTIGAPPPTFDSSGSIISSITNQVPITVSGISAATADPYFNVKAFGAKGDGSTIDTTAIQNAVNACPSTVTQAGCTVFFPPGEYVIDNSISIGTHPSVHLKGAGTVGLYTASFSVAATAASHLSPARRAPHSIGKSRYDKLSWLAHGPQHRRPGLCR